MGIKKIIRFEVFKRDGFQCGYCGKMPPEATLEIDHINPVSLGGSDDINNLLTACFDCNRGKRNVQLERIPNKLNDNLEILKEKELQLKEYNKWIKHSEKRIWKDIEEISQAYENLYPKWTFSDTFKNVSLKRFLGLLPKNRIIDFLHLAAAKFPNDNSAVISYFCGICWREIKGDNKYPNK